MLRYVGKRLLQMIPILIIVAILIFTLMYFVPGDPVQIILGDNASEEQIAETEAALGLDKPYIVRLGNYLLGICHLDFGTSYMKGTEVGADLMERFPNTLILATLSILFTIVIGIPLGIQCAMRANKATDKILMFLTMLGNSMPGFWLALLLVLLFSVKLNWLPSNGADSLKYFILPVVANSIGSLADITRQTRCYGPLQRPSGKRRHLETCASQCINPYHYTLWEPVRIYAWRNSYYRNRIFYSGNRYISGQWY